MLPPARFFPENGHVVMRSDWTPGATYALFRCGRYGEIDGAWGRNNADNLHFIINKRGILARRYRGRSFAQQCGPGFRRFAGPQRQPAAYYRVRPADHRPQFDHRGQRPAGTAGLERCLAGNRAQRRAVAHPGPVMVEGLGPAAAEARRPALQSRARSWPTRHRPGSTTRPAMPRTPTRPRACGRSRGNSSTCGRRPSWFFDRVVNAAAGLETSGSCTPSASRLTTAKRPPIRPCRRSGNR